MQTTKIYCPLSVKAVKDNGFFAGYASIFHSVDTQQDIILPGAFLRTLHEKNKKIKLLWQHHPDEPIGALTKVEEDANGLYVEGQLALDVQRGREAYALVKSGALSGLSIGYTPLRYHFDETQGTRYLTEVELWEISVVTFPANPEAVVTHLKGNDALETQALCQALEWAREVLSY